MNLVPTNQTRRLADRMIFQAQQTTGPDAVLQVLPSVPQDQLPALVGLLLTATKTHRKLGRPRLRSDFTEHERREAHRLYRRGERTDWVLAGQREYVRINQRGLRERQLGAAS